MTAISVFVAPNVCSAPMSGPPERLSLDLWNGAFASAPLGAQSVRIGFRDAECGVSDTRRAAGLQRVTAAQESPMEETVGQAAEWKGMREE